MPNILTKLVKKNAILEHLQPKCQIRDVKNAFEGLYGNLKEKIGISKTMHSTR